MTFRRTRGQARCSARGAARAVVGALLLAVAAACSAPEVAPPTAEETRRVALAEVDGWIAQQRWRAALERVDAALQAAPADRDWADRRLALLRHLGRERAALAYVEELRKTAPSDAALAHEAGELQAHLGELPAARASFEKAVALAPDDPRSAIALAALHLSAKPQALDRAEALLKPWLEGARANADAWFHQGLIEEARAEPKKGDANPSDTKPGDPAPRAAAISAALAAYSRAEALDPRHVAALCNHAALVAQAGDLPLAKSLLAKARDATMASNDLPRRAAIDRELARLDEQAKAPKDKTTPKPTKDP
jgi:Flp pilus assembly protein TadD